MTPWPFAILYGSPSRTCEHIHTFLPICWLTKYHTSLVVMETHHRWMRQGIRCQVLYSQKSIYLSPWKLLSCVIQITTCVVKKPDKLILRDFLSTYVQVYNYVDCVSINISHHHGNYPIDKKIHSQTLMYENPMHKWAGNTRTYRVQNVFKQSFC